MKRNWYELGGTMTAFDQSLQAMRAALSRMAEVLGSFARVWVEAQSHRAGL
jgi:hypothetical protein